LGVPEQQPSEKRKRSRTSGSEEHSWLDARYDIDPGTGQPLIHNHAVNGREVEDVLGRPIEDRPGREDARIALGQTRGGRFLRVIYVPMGRRAWFS